MAGKTDRKNLPVRTKRAKSGGQFGQVVSRNRVGQITKVRVPGSNMKAYEVIVRRRGAVSTECRLETPIGHMKCPGNSNGTGTICYHSMMALRIAAEDKGGSISWCADERDAEQLERFGGKKFTAYSWQSRGYLHGVYKSQN